MMRLQAAQVAIVGAAAFVLAMGACLLVAVLHG